MPTLSLYQGTGAIIEAPSEFPRQIFNSLIHFTAELGDYDPETHTPALVSEFRFVANQNEEFELDIFEEYKKKK